MGPPAVGVSRRMSAGQGRTDTGMWSRPGDAVLLFLRGRTARTAAPAPAVVGTVLSVVNQGQLVLDGGDAATLGRGRRELPGSVLRGERRLAVRAAGAAAGSAPHAVRACSPADSSASAARNVVSLIADR